MKKDNYTSGFVRFVSKYPRRIKVSMMFIIIVLCALLLFFEFGSEANFKKNVYYEIITGITFTTITVFIISIFNWIIGTKEIQEVQRDNTLQQMMDLLSGNTPDKNSIINELYSPEATSRILENALSRLNRRLAQSYCQMASCKEDVIRENFDYDISMFQNNNGSFSMEQNLKYKRYFRLPEKASSECYLQCGFAFSTNGLNKLLEQNSYFLREEITDPALVNQLKTAANNNDVAMIIGILHLNITTTINETEYYVKTADIQLEPIKDRDDEIMGIILRTKVNYTDEDDGFRSYFGRVSFVIPAPERKRVYCVFTDPIIGSTKFKFRIDPKMVTDINDVDYLEVLTRAGSGVEHMKRISQYTMEFCTSDTILPNSAIIAFW